MLGYGACRMPSGALHDASNLAGTVPSAMIFVPCKDGISPGTRANRTAATRPDGTLRFRRVAAPMSVELNALSASLAHRIGRFLERRVIVERDAENAWLVGAARGDSPDFRLPDRPLRGDCLAPRRAQTASPMPFDCRRRVAGPIPISWHDLTMTAF